MNERQPSQTALGAAGYRAAHQILEGGKVFADPLARTILGDGADAIIVQDLGAARLAKAAMTEAG